MSDRSLDDCFRVLGLRSSAGGMRIKRAFRGLVKEHHPDLQHSRADLKRFIQIVEAYTRLRHELQLHSPDEDTRPCPSCGKVAELLDGLDGKAACPDCLLGQTRRRLLLPLDVITTVKHGAVIALEAASIFCFVMALARESPTYAAISVATGVVALIILAVTCITLR